MSKDDGLFQYLAGQTNIGNKYLVSQCLTRIATASISSQENRK
ncbi:MAG: hypothetical protein WBP83_07670 [Nitrososphaeraceae archaeon]